ncbi:uncharacterized protein BCR38DRAFT_329480 [Pseudomassariella vexata]|uniref:Proteasome assembly chaperone 3 n=1 Tax=Pseudomassariella vexata TaxID=1141098 RepID=A0A1Y2EJ46_9PEZI|nr:uncharacterized protein BCR38DRAFT_329480 [Pseudomassariella vexata]ORY71570.1 hypothetical protein BCR38DRAFT_329480 [Pseudomassariella vexata]
MDSSQVKDEPFPAPSKRAMGTIDGVETEATSIFFSDKIMVTLSQHGRLSQWIQVPLSAPSPASIEMALPNASLLPMAHLTPKTLFGGGGEERESFGQLNAVQIGSLIARKNPEEQRTLLVGLGLLKAKLDREAFFDLIELIQKVL